uniref:FAST_1 domain-containing protein n=1 Tax=Gongylonema pulchrum TaxID=637853 RepID=A0A183E4L2_9BILA
MLIYPICAVLVLELSHEPIFKTLADAVRHHFATDLFSMSVSPIIRFASLVNSKKIRLPDDLYKQMREWLQLKASEITDPQDVVSVLTCWNKNDSWFNMFVEKAKGSISGMCSAELVGMLASLANNLSRPPHVLRLIGSAIEQNRPNLTLIVLAQSAARLHFMDAGLRRLVADETVANITRFSKWSQINALVYSLAKLRIGELRTWKAAAAWINNNQMNATDAELSYALYWCAMAGKCSLVQEAAEFLSEKLKPFQFDSAKTWLSSIYALAICERLSPELAETVLQASFVADVLQGLSGFRKLMTVTTVAQMQLFLKVILNKASEGPTLSITNLMQLPPAILDDMAMKLRYGRSEEGNVQYFHSLLHKLIPVNSHAFPPALTEDGIFVNAVMKFDTKTNRFVPLCQFESVKASRLAVIYLSWKDSTLMVSVLLQLTSS